MAHGYPDWGHARAVTVHPVVTDLAELAARLYSPVTFDRRGNVVWMDDFTHGKAAWLTIEGGTGSAVTLDTTNPQRGPYCLKLTGGSDDERASTTYRNLNAGVVGKFGLELSVLFATSWDYFRVRMDRRDGTNSYAAEVRLSKTDNEIQYLDSDGNYTSVATLTGVAGALSEYHTVKLVVDFSDNTYMRLIVNQNTYLTDAPAVETSSDVNPAQFYIAMDLISRSGQNDYCYVDGVIFTQNEP